MKKVFLPLGVFSVVGAGHAANVINGGPFDGPLAGGFYNVRTPLEVNSKFDHFVISDDFEYGITDDFSIRVSTSGSYDSSDNPQYGKWSWNNLDFGFDWTLWQQGELISEIYGDVKQIYDTRHNLETVAYNWTAGARVGRMADNWTVAGIVQLDYLNDDLPQDTFDAWGMRVGLTGQYLIDVHWNVLGSLMFDFDLFDNYYDGERLMLEFAINYNLDATKYLGVYAKKDVVHSFEHSPAVMGMVFGVVF